MQKIMQQQKQAMKLPDITKQFFTFLASERDNAESSFVATIHGRAGNGKTTDALGIAYTMLASDPTRFVAISAGRISIRTSGTDAGRRVRVLTDLKDVHQNDIIVADEFPVIGKSLDDNGMRGLDRMITYLRHKRMCAIVIAHGDKIWRSTSIRITTTDIGVATVESTYRRFNASGIVRFSASPFELDYRRAWSTTTSILTRDVMTCYHCLGIVKPTDEKCPYCGYYFAT